MSSNLAVKDNILNFSKKRARYVSFKASYEDIHDKLDQLCMGRANPLLLYLKMRSRIVREGWIDTVNYPIKRLYYDKGKLAMTMSIREMEKEFKMNKDTINRYIEHLSDLGYIKYEALHIKKKFNYQWVYIFGTWSVVNGKAEEHYYNCPWD